MTITSLVYLSVSLNLGTFADNVVDAVDQLLIIYQGYLLTIWTLHHMVPSQQKHKKFPVIFASVVTCKVSKTKSFLQCWHGRVRLWHSLRLWLLRYLRCNLAPHLFSHHTTSNGQLPWWVWKIDQEYIIFISDPFPCLPTIIKQNKPLSVIMSIKESASWESNPNSFSHSFDLLKQSVLKCFLHHLCWSIICICIRSLSALWPFVDVVIRCSCHVLHVGNNCMTRQPSNKGCMVWRHAGSKLPTSRSLRLIYIQK